MHWICLSGAVLGGIVGTLNGALVAGVTRLFFDLPIGESLSVGVAFGLQAGLALGLVCGAATAGLLHLCSDRKLMDE